MTRVKELAPDFEVPEQYGLVIVGLGYESRARWCTEKLSLSGRNSFSLNFGYSEVHSFSVNSEFFEGRGYQRINGLDPEVTSRLIDEIARSERNDRGAVSVAVDIS